MLTGEEYKETLFDGRAIFFGGKRVDDLPAIPILGTVRAERGRRLRLAARRTPSTGSARWPACRPRPRSCGRRWSSSTSRACWLARHLHVDHDDGDGRRPHLRDGPAVRRADPGVHRGRAAPRRPHHPVHHRRQGRSVAAAGQAGRSRCLRARRRPPARRCRHPRRQAPHHRGLAGPRADDHPHEGHEGGRGGLRHRRHGAGELAGREDREHVVRAASRRAARLPGVRPSPRGRGLRHLRRRVRPERPHLPERRGGRGVRLRPLARPVGAPRRAVGHGRRRRRARRPGAAHRRGQRARRAGSHQGEDLRDDHPRHGRAGVPRGVPHPRRDRSVRRGVPRRAVHERRQVHRCRQLQPDGAPPPRHRRRLHRHRAVDRRLREPRDGSPRAQVHGHPVRRRRRVPHPPVPRHPRPHRRHLRRLAGGDQHPGRRRALRPAHRDPRATTTSTGPSSTPSRWQAWPESSVGNRAA